MELTAENVRKVFLDCMFHEEMPQEGTEFIPVNGCMNLIGFNPEGVKRNEKEIEGFLSQLSKDFREGEGGGSSLINVPFIDGDPSKQWGEQRNADELMMLGMAIGRVKYVIEDRLLWQVLPGGVPYYVITKEKFEPELETVK